MEFLNKDIIKEEVLKIASEEFEKKKNEIGENTCIQSDLNCDSLKMINFVQKIESKFEIRVKDELLRNLRFLSEIINYLADEMEKKKCLAKQM